MKPQNGPKFPSELCFGIMNVTNDSYLLNSKIVFLKVAKMRKNGANQVKYAIKFLVQATSRSAPDIENKFSFPYSHFALLIVNVPQ